MTTNNERPNLGFLSDIERSEEKHVERKRHKKGRSRRNC